jgi:phosphatidate phosphatase APP1
MAYKPLWLRWIARADRALESIRRKLFHPPGADSSRQLHIAAFRGFANTHSAYLQGRILVHKPLFDQLESGWRKNLINSFRRFESDEIPEAVVRIQVGGNRFELITDREGYFTLDHLLPEALPQNGCAWKSVRIQLTHVPGRNGLGAPPQAESEVLLPHPENRLGIISDIDDTLLHTGVASPLKWRVIYYTFLMSISRRRPVGISADFCTSLSQGESFVRPVFYVSNSPWNIYDLLRDFLAYNGFPKGPILLRDAGIPYRDYPPGFPTHKDFTIARILQSYPAMQFVLVGDSGEKDAEIYLRIAKKFPDRIRAILIRDINHNRRTARVRRLLDESRPDIPHTIFDTYREAQDFLARHGII